MRRSSSHDHRSNKRRKYEERDSRVSGKIEEEREDRRRRWLIQQEQERKHELYKQKMILRYEIQRAREKELANSERDSSISQAGSSRDVQNIRSQSLNSFPKSDKPQTPPKTTMLSEKLESPNGNRSFFKGPEGTCISVIQLQCIKVNIQRSLPSAEVTNKQLQRDILNPEEIILKRRKGEGSKPIFERDELKQVESKASDIEESRRVIAVFTEDVEKSHSSKRPRVSLSPSRTLSRSPRRMLFEHNFRRGEDKQHCEKTGHGDYRKESKSVETYKEKNVKTAESPQRKTKYERSRSKEGERPNRRERERERRQSPQVYCYRSSRERTAPYRSHRGRSRELSSERCERITEREGERAMKRRVLPAQHYVEPVAVPFCYGTYQPPYHPSFHPNYAVMPSRGQLPLLRGRFPPAARDDRALPFPPRFIMPNAYRVGPMANPRFHRMF